MTMELWRTRPYGYGSFSQAVDRLFDQALRGGYGQGSQEESGGFLSLPVNIWETPEGYQAALLAAGLDEESINVTVHEDTLVVEGQITFKAPENAKPVWQEFAPSRFRRSLRLGAAVDPTKVEALYRNGLLMITMPKAEHARPRQIQVQVATNTNGTASGNKEAKK